MSKLIFEDDDDDLEEGYDHAAGFEHWKNMQHHAHDHLIGYTYLPDLSSKYPNSFFIAGIGGGFRFEMFKTEIEDNGWDGSVEVTRDDDQWSYETVEMTAISDMCDLIIRIQFTDDADMVRFKLEYL